MESKPKKRQVRKAQKATQEPAKSQAQPPRSFEALTVYNGTLVEGLIASEAWSEIVLPLLQEQIAGVSGRFSNGLYHHGSLTRDWAQNNTLFFAGYQKALMDFNNGIYAFVQAKEKMLKDKKDKESEKRQSVYNPFLEEED